VVEGLRQKGAVFVEELDEIPPGDAPVVFSAHGVPKSVPADARERNMFFLDATCPLVSKVHIEANRHFNEGREIVLIGHAGHVEVIGTMGQLPPGAITLVQTVEDAERFTPANPDRLAYVTQTTLSVDDTSAIVDVLRRRFPGIALPHKEDICYATTNRQEAVKKVAPNVDAMVVVGAPESSNSVRLVEVASRAGCPRAVLVERAGAIDWSQFDGIRTLGITAGASAPEALVDEVIDAFAARFDIEVTAHGAGRETIVFNLPRELRPTTPAP
jgi:4-hydroxy-3-methylbut-2-enyl diphosphate reductase